VDGTLKVLWNRRLFDTPQFQQCLATCQEFVDSRYDEEFLSRNLRLTVTETTDSQLFIVHGWFQNESQVEPTHHFITALPGPAVRPCTFSIAHVAFLSSSPHDPSIDCAVTVFERKANDEVALGLWLGSSQQAFMHMRLLPDALLGENEIDLQKDGWVIDNCVESSAPSTSTTTAFEFEFNSLGWRACWKGVNFHASAFNGEGPLHIVFRHYSVHREHEYSEGNSCACNGCATNGGRVAIGVRLPRRIADAEKAIEAFMSGSGMSPSAFKDYLAVPLLERRPRSPLHVLDQLSRDHEPSTVCCLSWSPVLQTHGMLMLVLLLLDANHHSLNTVQTSDVALVVHLPVDCQVGDFAHVLAALPLKHPWKRGSGERLMDKAALLVGRALERSASVPAPFPWSLPHSLSNRSVIEKGESLSVLVHPWLPYVLHGFKGVG
jgi:hypothetical protein